MNYQYQTSVIGAPECFLYYGEMKFFFSDGSCRVLETGSDGKEKWGDVLPLYVYDDIVWPLPSRLRMKWVDIAERKCYFLQTDIEIKLIEQLWQQKNIRDYYLYDFIAVGIAPYGKVAVWLRGSHRQTFIGWFPSVNITQEKDQLPYLFGFSLDEFCQKSLENDDERRKYLEQHGLPDVHLYDRMMQQFTYRLIPSLRWWNEDAQEWWEYDEEMEGDEMPTLDFVEVKCHDGTFDRLRDGSLLSYHQAGKPSRVCVGWHVGKREYSAYFFFSHDELAQVFRNCYGAHPDTKVDFLLQIDPESDKYEPALFRYGMKEPLAIGPDACQVLAFRNKFECYRSPNYTQPKGAWR